MILRMKERVTISVEPEVAQIARDQVESGDAANVSAAFEEALRAQGRKRALREALDMWEEEFGPIGEEAKEWARKEMARARREISSSTPER
jgi:Arc/MetJ-type ribon-helix-helix transcriptional regulator